MASKTLTLSGLEQAIRNLGKWRLDALNRVVEVLDETALMVETGAKENLTDSGTVDQGRLRASVVRQAVGPYSRTVGTNVEYGPAIEFGRSPGTMPPLEPIKAWAKRKGLPEGAAWPIALKIKQRGTPARPFLFPALEAERETFIKNLRLALTT